MGGFDPQYVTHLMLVLDAPTGSKCEKWRRHSDQAWAERLAVATSAWVKTCAREGRWVPEEEYGLREWDNARESTAAPAIH